MGYFKEIHSLADLKNQYHSLALANHPDRGGVEDVVESSINDQITDEARYIAERTVLKAEIRKLKRALRELDRQYPQYVQKKQ